MKTFRYSILAILVIACAPSFATSGPQLDVAWDGAGTAYVTTDAADGSYVEAVVSMNGADYIVDAAPVGSGMAIVFFPQGGDNLRVVLRDSAGNTLATAGYGGITEND